MITELTRSFNVGLEELRVAVAAANLAPSPVMSSVCCSSSSSCSGRPKPTR